VITVNYFILYNLYFYVLLIFVMCDTCFIIDAAADPVRIDVNMNGNC